MQHAWRSNERFAGWPRRCARADAPRLFARATAAFVDRTPVDWPALLSRVQRSPDRDLFHSLYGLAAVRHDVSTVQPSAEPAVGARTAASIVVALASVETALAFLAIAATVLAGGSIGGRAPQLVVAMAFTVASIRLAFANRSDERCVFLLATFAATASVFAHSAAGSLSLAWTAALARLSGAVSLDALVPACFCQFALRFPRVQRFTPFDRLATPAGLVLWAAGVLTTAVNIIGTTVGADVGPLRPLLRGDPSRDFWRFFSLAMATVVVVIAARTSRAPRDERRRIARLALAIVAGSAPFAAFGAARTLLPAIDAWFRRSGDGAAALYVATIVSLAATPLASVAALVADPSQRTWSSRRGVRRRSFGPVLSARPNHVRIASALDRLSGAGSPDAAVIALSDAIRDLVGDVRVAMWLDDRGGRFVHWSNPSARLPAASGLAALVRKAVGPEDVSPGSAWYSLLPASDRKWIVAHDVELIGGLQHAGGLGALVTLSGASHGPIDDRCRETIALLLAAVRLDERSGGDANMRESRTGDAGVRLATALECPACGVVEPSLPLRCGCRGAAALAALPGVISGRFHVERRIGSGRMGIVYLARDATLGRNVALKTTRPVGARVIGRLRHEAHAMAQLNHEALATVYDLVVWRDTPILVVEWLAGGTLADRLSSDRLRPYAVVALGVRLAHGLAYMHARGIVHRDVKPRNIAFTATGGAKLLDFGLAALAPAPRHRFVGTSAYAPAEALAGAPSSPDTDRWALAVVMLEALCGDNPFAGHRSAARARAALDSEPLRSSPAIRTFLSRALAPEPAARFQTTEEFVRALEALRA